MPPTPRAILGRIILLSLGIRVALQVIGMISVAVHGQDVWGRAVDMWSSWDAPHYLRIAEVGYVPAEPVPSECLGPNRPVHPCDDPLFIVFFPFFPAAVALVGLAVRNLVVSGLLVSFFASVGASYFLYRMVERDRGHAEAWRSVLLLLSFPTAYYLSAPYSEALFLFAVLASVYAARTDRWVRAGLAGALATGTRVTGVALGPALVVEAFSRRAGRAERARRLASIAIAGGGLAVYLLINQMVHGDPLHFLDVQRSHWFQHAVWPWQSLVDGVRAIARGPANPTETFIFWGRICGAAFAIVVLAVGIRRLRVADTTYAWTGLLLILSASWLLSLPRYLLVLYPIFLVGARLLRSRRDLIVAMILGGGLQVWLFWRYAVGMWTF